MNAKLALRVERRMRFMPCTVEPSDSVAHARALLEERRINHLPVVSKGRLVGIVSSHDLRARAFSTTHPELAKALEVHPDRVRVNSVMTTEVRTVKPSDNLSYAADLMLRKHIGALPVVEQGRLAGILSRSDFVGGSFAPGVKTKTQMNRGKSRSDSEESKSTRRVSADRAVARVKGLWVVWRSRWFSQLLSSRSSSANLRGELRKKIGGLDHFDGRSGNRN
jgi:acetoin utilization protein AcuB